MSERDDALEPLARRDATENENRRRIAGGTMARLEAIDTDGVRHDRGPLPAHTVVAHQMLTKYLADAKHERGAAQLASLGPGAVEQRGGGER